MGPGVNMGAGGLNNYLRVPVRVPSARVYDDYYMGYERGLYGGLNNYQYYFLGGFLIIDIC